MLKRILVVIVVLTLLGAAVLVVVAPKASELIAMMNAPTEVAKVRIQRAEPSTLIETVSAPGEIEPFTKVDISAEISARITELPFRSGERVKAGDVVVRLDARQLDAVLTSAKARREEERYRLQSEKSRLEGVRSTLDFAQRTLDRQTALVATGDVSQKAVDDAMERVRDLESSVNAALHTISQLESSLAAADAEISRAEEERAKTTITAPFDGQITQLNAEVGELVVVGTMNNPGTKIMTIADLSQMILVARVAESDVAVLEVGQSAQVRINGYMGRVFRGTVERIDLQRTVLADGTGHFKTRVRLDLEGTLVRSGHLANVDVEIAAHQGITVPSQAIVERLVEEIPEWTTHPLVDRAKKMSSVVYRFVDGKAVCTPVRPGPSDLTDTLVAEGLSEGDMVIVGPYKALEKLKHDEVVLDELAEAAATEPATAPAATAPSDGVGE